MRKVGIGESMSGQLFTLGSETVLRISAYWSSAIRTKPSAPTKLRFASCTSISCGSLSRSTTSSAAADAIFKLYTMPRLSINLFHLSPRCRFRPEIHYWATYYGLFFYFFDKVENPDQIEGRNTRKKDLAFILWPYHSHTCLRFYPYIRYPFTLFSSNLSNFLSRNEILLSFKRLSFITAV